MSCDRHRTYYALSYCADCVPFLVTDQIVSDQRGLSSNDIFEYINHLDGENPHSERNKGPVADADLIWLCRPRLMESLRCATFIAHELRLMLTVLLMLDTVFSPDRYISNLNCTSTDFQFVQRYLR